VSRFLATYLINLTAILQGVGVKLSVYRRNVVRQLQRQPFTFRIYGIYACDAANESTKVFKDFNSKKHRLHWQFFQRDQLVSNSIITLDTIVKHVYVYEQRFKLESSKILFGDSERFIYLVDFGTNALGTI
jgi:hypothetical protein